MVGTYKFVKSLGFPNIQEYINANVDPDDPEVKYVNVERLNIVLTHMFSNGWQEILPSDIEENTFTGNTQIRYILNIDGMLKYRTGGFFRKFFNKGDVTSGEMKTLTNDVILYRSHLLGNVNIFIQMPDVDKFYFKEKILKGKKSKGVKYKIPTVKTKYPVCMVDSEGVTQTIYYAKDTSNRNVFMSTPKFKRALKEGWSFKEE